MIELLTAEMALALIRATISLNVDDRTLVPKLYPALTAIATGRAQVVALSPMARGIITLT